MERTDGTEELWRSFHARLTPFIRSRVATAQDTEDILQEVFLRIHSSRDRLAEVRDLPAWIYRIATNAITDYYRGRSRQPLSWSLVPNDPSARRDPGPTGREPRDCDCSSGDELTNCLDPLVEFLPKPYREAIRLTDLGKLTQKEAAAEAGISLSGMKSRVQRGREKLKDLLVSFCASEIESHYG